MVTRRQHFVFRYYLDFWAEGGTVRTLRAGRLFETNPINVAVGRDFYSINRLTPEDMAFFHQLMCSPPVAEQAIKANREWAERYVAFGEAAHVIETSARATDADKEASNGVRIELFEKLHGGMEERAVSLLSAIREGDTSFLSGEAETIDFLCYIAHQMFRTKKMRDQLLGGFAGLRSPESMQRLQNLMAFCMAETVAGSLYVDRGNYTSKILTTNGRDEFITSDQPVINLLGSGDGTPPEHLVFYYPIGADRAFLYYPNELPFDEIGEDLSENEVRQLNQAILRMSHEFLFSSKRFALQEFSSSIAPGKFKVPLFIQETMKS